MTIQEILTGLGVEYKEAGAHHHTRPGWIQIETCPFCESHNYHLGVNLSLRYCACWKCGGHHLGYTLEKLGVSRRDVKEFLDDSDQTTEVYGEKKRTGLKEPRGRGPLLPAHRAYLRERRFNPKKLEEIWKIEGIGIASRLSWRIYIPIIYQSKRVSWTTRSLASDAAQRYLSASAEEEAINHKHVIYGLDYCQHSIVIVEGPTDAWRVGHGAGAVLGIAYTSAQVLELTRIPYRYICFDSSASAQSRAHVLANELACFPGITQNIVLDAKDPGCASAREIRLLRKSARI